MIYLIEFAILHLLFYVVYKLFLAKETQLSFLRKFLIGTTLLSLIVPFVELPNSTPIPALDTEAIILPVVNLIPSTSEHKLVNWPLIILSVTGSILLGKLISNLLKIRSLYKKSKRTTLGNISVFELNGLENSFTFFNWIFIDTPFFENPKDIARHEYGHAKMLHSADILFFNLLTMVFWWVPSIWLMIKELKKVHEFEADQFAISISDETYVKTLVHCTLKAHGMNLASSFDDATIFNRLNFINTMKKKMNPLKVVSIISILAISATMFACEEKLGSEESSQPLKTSEVQSKDLDDVFTIVEDPASFPGGMGKWGAYLSSSLKYPKKAKELGIEGNVLIQFIVEKDGSISEAIAIKGIGSGCDEEALRVVKESPIWNPGKQGGQTIRQQFVQKISFSLPKK